MRANKISTALNPFMEKGSFAAIPVLDGIGEKNFSS
jgi:hypothetical protein